MTELDGAEVDEVDLAVVAYLDDGEWQLDDLPDRALGDVVAVAEELRRYPDPDALALISVGDDFALLVRSDEGRTQVVLSDVTAALEWGLARTVADLLGVEVDDDEEPGPAGDLSLLVDAGISAHDLAALIDDEPVPEELLAAIADELGFGDDFEEYLEDSPREPAEVPDEDDEDDVDEPVAGVGHDSRA